MNFIRKKDSYFDWNCYWNLNKIESHHAIRSEQNGILIVTTIVIRTFDVIGCVIIVPKQSNTCIDKRPFDPHFQTGTVKRFFQSFLSCFHVFVHVEKNMFPTIQVASLQLVPFHGVRGKLLRWNRLLLFVDAFRFSFHCISFFERKTCDFLFRSASGKFLILFY